jgi:hypothetical protein
MRYSIEAAMFELQLPAVVQKVSEQLTKFFSRLKKYKNPVHCFWVLFKINEEGVKIKLAELQGFATSVNGEIKPIGNWPTDKLKVYHLCYEKDFATKWGLSEIAWTKRIQWPLPIHSSFEVMSGDEEIFTRWKHAVDLIDQINNLNLSYPMGGINLLNAAKENNSNSIYKTFADIWEIAAYQFPDFQAPGIQNSLFPFLNVSTNQIRVAEGKPPFSFLSM